MKLVPYITCGIIVWMSLNMSGKIDFSQNARDNINSTPINRHVDSINTFTDEKINDTGIKAIEDAFQNSLPKIPKK